MKNQIAVISIAFCVFLTGCVKTKARGVLNDRIYYSTYSPNIQIKMSPDFTCYNTGKSSNYDYMFINDLGNKYVVITYFKQHGPENIIDYYTPSRIFNDVRNKIDSGTLKILGETWYYCDYFKQFSPESCGMVRDLAVFTQKHDWLMVRYIETLPYYDCDSWSDVKNLTSGQKEFISNFTADFSSDIEMDNYTPAREETGKPEE